MAKKVLNKKKEINSCEYEKRKNLFLPFYYQNYLLKKFRS